MPRRATYIIYVSLANAFVLTTGAGATNTSFQHQDWARKLETPGGTFSAPPVREESSHLGNTGEQHQQWMRKLESLGGTFSPAPNPELALPETTDKAALPSQYFMQLFPLAPSNPN